MSVLADAAPEKQSRKVKKPKEGTNSSADARAAPDTPASKGKSKKSKRSEDVAPHATDPSTVPVADHTKVYKKKEEKMNEDSGSGGTVDDASVIDTIDVSGKKPSKKRKDDKAKDSVSKGDADGDGVPAKKSRKKGKKGTGDEAMLRAVDSGDVDGAREDTVMKDANEEQMEGNVEKKDKTRKKKRERGADGEEAADEGEQEEKTKKRKKEKRKRVAETAETQEDDGAAKAHKQKKRKRVASEFSDPNEDESLSDQARKALSYAYTQFEDAQNWKFNKARQNWLVRNIWSAEAIPDSYIPLVTRYLANAKGGVREALIKTCRDALVSAPQLEEPAVAKQDDASVNPSVTEPNTASPSKITTLVTDELKQQRATSLLAALEQQVS